MLIKQYQIDGLVSLRQTLESIAGIPGDENNPGSYSAAKVTTNIAKPKVDPDDPNEEVQYYTTQDLLTYLNSTVSAITGGISEDAEDGSLASLTKKLNRLNAELNGGSYLDDENATKTVVGFKKKEIKDVVRVVYNLDAEVAIDPVSNASALISPASLPDELTDTALQDASIQAVNAILPAYAESDGKRLVSQNGENVTFNIYTGKFSAKPYILDIDQSASAGTINAETGQVVAGSETYTAFTGQFKVFPQGKWTLETLPADALLDNSEMQMVAYDDAIRKLVLQLALDSRLIERLTQAIDQTAVENAVKDATEKIDTRLDLLEARGAASDSNLARAAVMVSQITGEPAHDEAAAETINRTTTVVSKAYVDYVINAANGNIGTNADTGTYSTATGKISASTVYGYINGLNDHYFPKDKLVDAVKPNVRANVAEEGQPANYSGEIVAAHDKAISEYAIVEKFSNLNSEITRAHNRITYESQLSEKKYIDNADIVDTFTKITANEEGNYVSAAYATITYTDEDGSENTIARTTVVGSNIFNEKISEITDKITNIDQNFVKKDMLQLAVAVAADSTNGVSAKNAESAVDSTTKVYTKIAVDNKVDTISETLVHQANAIDDKTYDWDNIEIYDGNAITKQIQKTEFVVSTGAAETSTVDETVVPQGTAEVSNDSVAVWSASKTDKQIQAAIAALDSKIASDKQEILYRIQHEAAVRDRQITAEISKLTVADSTATIAAANYGQNAIVAEAVGPIYALQQNYYNWHNVIGNSGVAADITYVNSNGSSETVASSTAITVDQNTQVASKAYVDEEIAKAVIGAKIEAKAVDTASNNAMNGRVDKLEKVYTTTKAFKPSLSDGTITLTYTPITGEPVFVNINGIVYNSGDGCFTISNKVITWSESAAGFSLAQVLEASDNVYVTYTYEDTTKELVGKIS